MRALAGHVSRAMLSWYSHIRTDAKRAVTSALDQIGDAWEVADSGRGTAQNWAQSHAVPKHTLNYPLILLVELTWIEHATS